MTPEIILPESSFSPTVADTGSDIDMLVQMSWLLAAVAIALAACSSAEGGSPPSASLTQKNAMAQSFVGTTPREGAESGNPTDMTF